MRGMNSAEIPAPVSLISTFTASSVAPTRGCRSGPPGSVYFAAFVITLPKTLHQAREIAFHVQRLETGVHGDLVLLRAPQRRHGFHREIDDIGQQQCLAFQLDVTHRDARHVEQIVDDSRELRGLPPHYFRGAPRRLIVRHAARYDFGGRADRRQRIAQLVREHRQEFILAPVRFAKRGIRQRASRHVDTFHENARDLAVRILDGLVDEIEITRGRRGRRARPGRNRVRRRPRKASPLA